MNQDEIQGSWKMLKGKVRQKWGQLTDDEVEQTRGDTEMLAGKIQQKYGGSKEEIKRQLDQMAA